MISKKITFILITILTLNSCIKELQNNLLEKEEKFTLSIGNMDNEMDFFARNDIPFSLDSDIYMSKGIFYISNGNGKKIMKFNSYGDLLSKISPARQSDTSPKDSGSWTFNKPGSISKTDNFTYIVDSLEYDNALSENYIDKSFDTSSDKSNSVYHILNEMIISLFDNNGSYLGFVGQNGLNSTPFPFIKNIYNDHLNRLIVVTQSTFFWSIFRFTEDGVFIDKNIIELDYLPQLENVDDTITQINNIIPDREKDRVLVDLAFYKKYYDDKTGATISMELIKSRVYYYDLNDKNYISWMDIPTSYKNDTTGNELFVLLDIVRGKYLYFISQTPNGNSQMLTITNENGYTIGNYDLQIDNANIIYESFYSTQPEGILTALLCTDYAAGITLWRTDVILDEDSK